MLANNAFTRNGYPRSAMFMMCCMASFIYVEGEVKIRGPKDVTVTVGGNVFMECIVMGAPGPPTPFWCISGKTYTPSTLPDRFTYNSTGLVIYPIVLEDNGLVVQCSIDIIDLTTSPFSITTINSSIGVVHVIVDGGGLTITTVPSSNFLQTTEFTTFTTTSSIGISHSLITTRHISASKMYSKVLSIQTSSAMSESIEVSIIPVIAVATSAAVIGVSMIVFLTLGIVVVTKHKRKSTLYLEDNQAYAVVPFPVRQSTPEPLYDNIPSQAHTNHITTNLNTCYETVLHADK